MLHLSAIDTPTLELLKILMQVEAFHGLRLAGGTSLALQLGHRKSIDLDLFGSVDFESLQLQQIFQENMKVVSIKRSKNINIFAINDIKVDFVNYAYPWLEDPIIDHGIRLAGISDIAAMKLAAITGRGSRKDFVDLYYLLQKYSLSDLLKLYTKKYSDGSEYMVVKSLVYFEDAEHDVDVEMLTNITWEQIKKHLIREVRKFSL